MSASDHAVVTGQGCSDGNCKLRIGEPPRQHTNGGCRCLRDVPTELRLKIERKLKDKVSESEEKSRRVYYQNIVYAVCCELDRISGARTVCGTIEEPSSEVQRKMFDAHEIIKAAKNVVSQMQQHGGPYPQYPELHAAIEKLDECLSR